MLSQRRRRDATKPAGKPKTDRANKMAEVIAIVKRAKGDEVESNDRRSCIPRRDWREGWQSKSEDFDSPPAACAVKSRR
jgi:hypothetical protein